MCGKKGYKSPDFPRCNIETGDDHYVGILNISVWKKVSSKNTKLVTSANKDGDDKQEFDLSMFQYSISIFIKKTKKDLC